jgi:hypothetical protein
MDFAKAARAEPIMAFHSHDLCYGGHVSKDKDKEGTEDKLFPGAEI